MGFVHRAARYAALVDQLPRPPTGEPLYVQIGNELNNGVSHPSAANKLCPRHLTLSAS